MFEFNIQRKVFFFRILKCHFWLLQLHVWASEQNEQRPWILDKIL